MVKYHVYMNGVTWAVYAITVPLPTNTKVRAWVNNYIKYFRWDVTNHAHCNVKCGSANTPLYDLLFTVKAWMSNCFYDFMLMYLLINTLNPMLVELMDVSKTALVDGTNIDLKVNDHWFPSAPWVSTQSLCQPESVWWYRDLNTWSSQCSWFFLNNIASHNYKLRKSVCPKSIFCQ